jgi:hypothetical protein
MRFNLSTCSISAGVQKASSGWGGGGGCTNTVRTRPGGGKPGARAMAQKMSSTANKSDGRICIHMYHFCLRCVVCARSRSFLIFLFTRYIASVLQALERRCTVLSCYGAACHYREISKTSLRVHEEMTTKKEQKFRGLFKITTKTTLIFAFSNILVKFYFRLLMSSLLCLFYSRSPQSRLLSLSFYIDISAPPSRSRIARPRKHSRIFIIATP